ncbi:GSCOCG00001975001-RA-CDS [Cotesia congregata]|nr:GSCOCG00001975001-RA-CDS [Cotesia congregata]
MSGPDVKIKLINCVRKYPGLYKPSYEMYRNRNYAITAWEKIMKECNIESITKAKDMWASLRKSYTGHLKAPGEKKAPKYFEEMNFLRQYIPETAADGFDDDEPVKLKAVPKPKPQKAQTVVKAGALKKKQPAEPKEDAKIPDDLNVQYCQNYVSLKIILSYKLYMFSIHIGFSLTDFIIRLFILINLIVNY